MPDRDFGLLLSFAYSEFVRDLRESLAARGFPELHQWTGYVVRALEAEPMTLKDLAARLGMTAQGAIKIVDHLEQEGFIRRTADPKDGRAKRLEIAPRGAELLAAASAFHRDYESKLADRFGAKAVAILRAQLEAISGDDQDPRHERLPRPS